MRVTSYKLSLFDRKFTLNNFEQERISRLSSTLIFVSYTNTYQLPYLTSLEAETLALNSCKGREHVCSLTRG
jgi:hypothetical protein